MFQRGTRSWRFSHGSDQAPHALLFVRDSLGLPVGAGPGNPPRLDGDVPDLAGRLDERTRREAGQQWPAWWRDVLARDGAMNLRDGGTNDPPPPAGAMVLRARETRLLSVFRGFAGGSFLTCWFALGECGNCALAGVAGRRVAGCRMSGR